MTSDPGAAEPPVLTEVEAAVTTIRFNRPDAMNALDTAAKTALRDAVLTAADDPAVRCVVLRGDGPMFSSGMDLGALQDMATRPEELRAFRRACTDGWNLAEDMAKPTICAIHGACIGGALELALACDLRVIAEDAIVGLPETRIGLIPDVGGSSRLPQLVGVGRAKELILTGKMIDGREAERIGLATRVVPAAELGAAVDALAGELLACAPIAVGLAKRAIDASARPALSTTLELELALQEVCARSADFAEGAAAMREKRAPNFTGR